MQSQLSRTAALTTAVVTGGLCAVMTSADVFFTHDIGVAALPPPPANAVFAAPDVQDIFYSPAFIRTAPGPNLGNVLIANNPGALGLLPGDNIDAMHHEVRAIPAEGDFFPSFVFSVNVGATGAPGTPVAAQAPANAADLYESNGLGLQTRSLNENQIGLAPLAPEDVDGVFLTQATSVDVGGWVYFSLTPGSPSLALLGASPADILAVRAGGTPLISITAAQLGLNATDDVDGLCILGGVDGNDDGDFNDPGDGLPFVNFSVSPNSLGLPGTAVRNQVLTDPPVGGDIYLSLSNGANTLFRDDGAGVLGLAQTDDIDGLDLAAMAVPGVSPFIGGLGGGGGPGGPGIGQMRFSLCKNEGYSNSQQCTLTVIVFVACNGRLSILVANVTVNCDDCDDSNGSEINAAVAAIGAAVSGMVVPAGNPGAGPDAGRPVFGGPGVMSNPSPGHVDVTLPVNPALQNCAVVGAVILRNSCPCYSQDVAALPWAKQPTQELDTNIEISAGAAADPGLYLLQFGKDGEPMYIPTPAGSGPEVVAAIADYLASLDYTIKDIAPDAIWVTADPDGAPISDVWANGWVEGGPATSSIGVLLEGYKIEDADFIPDDLRHDR